MTGRQEGTSWDEHWVFYVSDEALNSTPATHNTLYVNLCNFYLNSI